MTHTALFLLLSLAPIVAGFLAFGLAVILASFRVATAPYIPEHTARESAEWAADLSLELDVDAEWCALADAPEAAPVRALAPLTVATIDAFRAERAAVDAFIASRPVVVMAARTYTANASRGVAAAAARIVVRVTHTAEAIACVATALVPEAKLVSPTRLAFLAEAKRGIAAHTARRTLYPTLSAAFTSEWSEAMSEPYALASESHEARSAVALDSLARLAALQLDTSERKAIHAEEDRAHLASLAA